MKPTLINPTDYELNAAFAERVAGMKRVVYCPCGEDCGSWENQDGSIEYMPRFTESADDVLPWLRKQWGGMPDAAWAGRAIADGTFARQAVIYLLRANGVEVVFK